MMICVRLTPIEGCVTALTGPSTRVRLYLRLPAHRWIAFTTAKEPHLPQLDIVRCELAGHSKFEFAGHSKVELAGNSKVGTCWA